MSQIDEKDVSKPRTKANTNFHEKRDARISRFEELADKNRDSAEARFDTASQMAKQIPLGQPIMIGHHSEKRDRNFRDRISTNMQKGVEHQHKADYYSSKASTALSNNSIMSDDPDALKKIRAKIQTLESSREFMKAVNKVWRRSGKPAPNDPSSWEKIAKDPSINVELVDLQDARMNLARTPWQEKPYPTYCFQNLSSNIRRLKARLALLVETERRETITFEINGVEVREEDGRINVYFPTKPNDEFRQRLKSYPLSLKWSRYAGCWGRKVTENTGSYFVESLKSACRDFKA